MNPASVEKIRSLASCLANEQISDHNRKAVEEGFIAAIKAEKNNDYFLIGRGFAFSVLALCKGHY